MKKYLQLFWPLYIAEFVWAFMLPMSIWVLFFQSRGLDLTGIGLTLSAVYLANFVLEYPTGIFADRYGRKLSLLCASLGFSISLLLEVTAYSLTQFVIAGFFAGASFSFLSGAYQAYVYESLKSKKLERKNSAVLGSLDTVGATSGMLAAVLGSIVYAIHETLPYWITLAFSAVAFIALLFLNEPKRKKTLAKPRDDSLESLHIIFRRPTMLTLLLLYIVLFFFEEGWTVIAQPTLTSIGLPVVLLGTYAAGKRLLMAWGGLVLPWLLRFGHGKIIFSMIVLEAIVLYVLGTNHLASVILFSYIMVLIHQLWNYVDADIIHDHIPSRIRATTLSARQMVISCVWILNPWFLGYLVSIFPRPELFAAFGGIVFLIGTVIFLVRKKYL